MVIPNMLPIPLTVTNWKANNGISPNQFVDLAQAEGLRPIKLPTPL